ncbi:MAG: hypothetical protein C3F02_00005 [Parcubacteria group bacterium]|nr:MAG: hypothetical protein C3F02_00005 [Parcubacteria group bacterium]
MPKILKQKKTITTSTSTETHDREVVLEALQNVALPEKIKMKKVTISTASKPRQVVGLIREAKKEQTTLKQENETAAISLKDQTKDNVFKNLKRRDRYWLKTVPFFMVILFLGVICFLQAGLYFEPSIRPLSETIASAIHYPVAVVGTKVVRFTDFKSERDLLETYAEKGFSFASDDANVKMLALNKIVRDTYISIGEKEFDVSVPDSSVEKAFVNLFGTQSNSQDGYTISELTLGLKPEEIKQQIIRPYLEKSEFSKKLVSDPDFLQQQKNIAEQLKINFSNAPDSFSDKSAHAFLGVTFYDLGYVSSSSLLGKYSSIASLETGAISDVFEDAEAFSLFRVVEKLPQEIGSYNQYVSLQKIEIKKINADLWIDSKLRTARIAVFDPTLSWNSACRQVTETDACLSGSNKNNSVSLDSLYEALTGDSSIFLPDFTSS